ncbi:MAG: methyltransferase domain-containing protein [Chloroflexi bacterium]|nr:methyltransferase domain-containing protein [Chloroflexota bacterium]MCI0581215.1 methyltransferase domain-containing protein [Chloroflexota bacterium]MCI0644074.1 methyltransferase domain-containing protein [Chloroflexota bacterium]MCI0727890.1 methyltransferase domain-containing protein [Chloroflexota bacterium]
MLSLERQNELRRQYQQINPGWRPATEVYAGLVRHHLRPNSRLLDLGCGRGGLVEQLDHQLLQVVGVDPDWRSLREHRLANHRPPLPRVAAASRALPFARGSFDLVMASWLLEHLVRPEEDFHQVGRLLRPGGHFIFVTPNRRHPLIRLNRLAGRFAGLQGRLVHRLYGRALADTFPAYYRANTPAQLERLAQESNLKLVSLDVIPDPTYLAFTPTLFHLACSLDERLPSVWRIHLVGCLQRL